MKLEATNSREFDEKISHRFRGEGWDLNPSDSSWCGFIVEDMKFCSQEESCETWRIYVIQKISGSKLFMGWISFTDLRKTDRLIDTG